MKVTIDLDTYDITAPKTFLEQIAKENKIIEKAGGTPIDYKTRILKAVQTGLDNSDEHFKLK